MLKAEPGQPEIARELHSRTPEHGSANSCLFPRAACISVAALSSSCVAAFSRSLFYRELRKGIQDRFVDPRRFDVAAELAQWVETLHGARARIGNEIVEPVLASDNDKTRDAAGQSHSYDHGISAGEIRSDYQRNSLEWSDYHQVDVGWLSPR
jgi:hypothetical protein